MKTLAISLFLLSTLTFAQHDTGNGGGIHYCPERAQQELYDIYEGRIRYGLEIPEREGFVQTIIAEAMTKLARHNPRLAADVRTQLERLERPQFFGLKPKIRLMPIPDAHILLTDEGCDYRQVANWDNVTDIVLVKLEYFNSLNPLHQAGLYLHEAIYKVARDRFNEPTSDRVRRFVAELLSTKTKLSDTFDIPSDVGVLDKTHKVGMGQITKSHFRDHRFFTTINLGSQTEFPKGLGTIRYSMRELLWLNKKISEKQKAIQAATKAKASLKEIYKLIDLLNIYEGQRGLLKSISFTLLPECRLIQDEVMECPLTNRLTVRNSFQTYMYPFQTFTLDVEIDTGLKSLDKAKQSFVMNKADVGLFEHAVIITQNPAE